MLRQAQHDNSELSMSSVVTLSLSKGSEMTD